MIHIRALPPNKESIEIIIIFLALATNTFMNIYSKIINAMKSKNFNETFLGSQKMFIRENCYKFSVFFC